MKTEEKVGRGWQWFLVKIPLFLNSHYIEDLIRDQTKALIKLYLFCILEEICRSILRNASITFTFTH